MHVWVSIIHNCGLNQTKRVWIPTFCVRGEHVNVCAFSNDSVCIPGRMEKTRRRISGGFHTPEANHVATSIGYFWTTQANQFRKRFWYRMRWRERACLFSSFTPLPVHVLPRSNHSVANLSLPKSSSFVVNHSSISGQRIIPEFSD